MPSTLSLELFLLAVNVWLGMRLRMLPVYQQRERIMHFPNASLSPENGQK
jgi:hypothetical protein